MVLHLSHLVHRDISLHQQRSVKTKLSKYYKINHKELILLIYISLSLSPLHTYQVLLCVHKFIHRIRTLSEVFTSYCAQNSLIHCHSGRQT